MGSALVSGTITVTIKAQSRPQIAPTGTECRSAPAHGIWYALSFSEATFKFWPFVQQLKVEILVRVAPLNCIECEHTDQEIGDAVPLNRPRS